MNYYEILTGITLFFLLVATVNLCRYRRKYQLLHREHMELFRENADLSDHCSELKEKIEETQLFKNNLIDAEITTKLQATRTCYQTGETTATAPERYNYIKALSESGMEPETIAGLLSISTQEAEQLVSLSRLGDTCRSC